MFVEEVLKKLPVMQHFLFGSLVLAADGMSAGEVGDEAGESEGDEGSVVMHEGMKHVHSANSWGDCCGIHVPSAVAAAQESRKHGGKALRRLPFD
jgi:serine/threonine-protein phosphatase 2A activator